MATRVLRSPLWRDPVGVAGGIIVLLLVIMALAAPFLAHYDPLEFQAGARLAPPSARFWLGADEFGRDIYSRILHGARLSLIVGLGATLLGSIVGTAMGLVSGYFGGRVDAIIQRGVDIMLALPGLILALALMVALGAGVTNVMIAIAVAMVPEVARVVRGAALAARHEMYVEAALALGCSQMRILFRHIAPAVFAPWMVITTAFLGKAILTEATLSFLGAGVPPPAPSWGGMLTTAKQFVERAPWVPLFPGIAISLAVFGFSLFGDALRDALDPRLRGTR
ncbi:MAG: ABC transporter permease [Chloroflexi bacterium]|nr:ABC transporter permease [Chloroflexota bacterium]